MKKTNTLIFIIILFCSGHNQKLKAMDSYKEFGFISGNLGSGVRFSLMWKLKPGTEIGFSGRFYDIKNEGEFPVYDPYTGTFRNTNDNALIFLPFMFSYKYHPFEGKIANNFSPFISLNSGPNLAINGNENKTSFKKRWIKAPTILNYSGNISIGIDFLLQNRIKLSASAGYDIFPMGQEVDGQENYNGFLIKIGISKAGK